MTSSTVKVSGWVWHTAHAASTLYWKLKLLMSSMQRSSSWKTRKKCRQWHHPGHCSSFTLFVNVQLFTVYFSLNALSIVYCALPPFPELLPFLVHKITIRNVLTRLVEQNTSCEYRRVVRSSSLRLVFPDARRPITWRKNLAQLITVTGWTFQSSTWTETHDMLET